MVLCVRVAFAKFGLSVYCNRADLHTGYYVLRAMRGKSFPFRRKMCAHTFREATVSP